MLIGDAGWRQNAGVLTLMEIKIRTGYLPGYWQEVKLVPQALRDAWVQNF